MPAQTPFRPTGSTRSALRRDRPGATPVVRWQRLRRGAAVPVLAALAVGCSFAGGDDATAETVPADQTTSEVNEDAPGTTEQQADGPAEDEAGTPTGAPGVLADGGGSALGFEAPAAWFAAAGDEEPALVFDAERTFGSPDGRYLAVETEPDAVDRGRFDILATDSDEVVDSVEYEGQGAGVPVWAPDGSALLVADEVSLYLHHVEGDTAVATFEPPVVGLDVHAIAADDSGAAAVVCDSGAVYALSTAGEPTVTPKEDSLGACRAAHTLDADGRSVGLVSLDGTVSRLAPDGTTTPVEVTNPTAEPYLSVSAPCAGIITIAVNGDVGADPVSGVYVPAADAIVLADRTTTNACPQLSPDGSHVTMSTVPTPGPLVSVEVATGEVVEIARTGSAIGWSSDSSSVLLEGNGLFVVAADGSGEAEVDGPEGITSLDRWCRLMGTGLVLLAGGGDGVLYDIGSGRSTAVAEGELDGFCSVDADGSWALAGDILIDVEAGTTTALPRLDRTSLDTPVQGVLRHHRFRGPQSMTLVGNASLYQAST